MPEANSDFSQENENMEKLLGNLVKRYTKDWDNPHGQTLIINFCAARQLDQQVSVLEAQKGKLGFATDQKTTSPILASDTQIDGFRDAARSAWKEVGLAQANMGVRGLDLWGNLAQSVTEMQSARLPPSELVVRLSSASRT